MPPGSGDWLVAGVVGRPHGLDGSFHVAEARAELLAAGMFVEVDGARVEIERRAGTDRKPIVRLAGHDDRNAADRLRGRSLRVERAEAPRLEEGEWWTEELEGCEVYDGERKLGTVRTLLGLPSCEVLEVETQEDDLLIPLVKDAIEEVAIAEKRIQVHGDFLGLSPGSDD